MVDVIKEAELKGSEIYTWVEELFPICRSITGQGLRDTLTYIKNILPELKVFEVKSGTKVFDWEVPDEWNISEAYITDENEKIIVDFKDNNLHVVGYSEPIDEWLNLDDLDKNLHSLPDQPSAVPYLTSYYKRTWGFCMSHNQRQSLKPGKYHVVINSKLEPGFLNYGELLIPGKSKEEVFLSSYICHPSMANNELSGPTVLTALSQWLRNKKDLKNSYRIIFIPETIGSITYLSRNIDILKKEVIAGFNISCVGDEGRHSYIPSRSGDALSDEVAKHVLKHIDPNYISYTWLDRGSDERQYCSPGVDLPVVGISRSKFGEFPECHTSLDNLDFVTPKGLAGSYLALLRMVEILEKNKNLKTTILCEPQLGKRGLYPTLSFQGSSINTKPMMNLISYCDGQKTLLEIADIISVPFWELIGLTDELSKHGLLEVV